ncbi:MAG: two-component system, chemotaxis family, sensor histidine kinase and response regulator WspE [Thermodesulfobacteriota bacterium]|nr:two-component system, chemotaxis family, sensor histidine kinase and response regulator WspE [Thermodesulfobacteriota bacterium]
MDQNGHDPDDHSIMDLFRAEVDRHAVTISDGLLALEKDPAAADRLDAMTQAVHAIKGGAQIVDLDGAVAVARSMEASFVAAQKGTLSLGSDAIEILLKGVDMLNQLARSADEPEWLTLHEEEIGHLVAAMNGISSPPSRPETAAPRTPIAATSAVGEKVPTRRKEAGSPQTSVIADPAMLDLFRTEAQNYVAELNDGLLALEENPDAIDLLDPLIQAAHSIKGAARIVGFGATAKVSQAMEDCFAAARKGQAVLGPEHIHMLLKGVETLNQITEAVDTTGSESVERSQDGVEELMAAIQGILSAKTMVPLKSPPHAAPSMDAAPAKRDTTTGEGQMDRVDPTMLDLFQAEVETHVAVLNDGLLALESNPGATDQLEALMRAAHSIKGGARVLGLDVAVRAAHVMEDCFVAAQKGEVSLGPDQIDILLRIVDILTQLAHSLSQGETDWLGRHRDEIDRLVGAISAIINGEQAIPVSPVETSSTEPARPPTVHPPEPVPAHAEAEVGLPSPVGSVETLPQVHAAEDKDRTVRVTAGKIERLMGQAGEVVVNARWLPAFSEALLELKRNHGELLAILDGLQEVLVQDGSGSEASDLVLRARTKTKECSRKVGERLNQFDLFNGTSAALSDRLYHEVISVRMRPFSDGIQGFPRMVRDVARELGKKVRLEIKGKSTEVDRDILEKLDAPLNHLLRNALDHGIEPPEDRVRAGKPESGSLRLEAAHRSGMLMITLADDGRGIDLDGLRRKIVEKGLASEDMVEKMSEPELLDFLFLPGFSTAQNVTEISGRGVGLDVVRNMVHDVGGVVRAVSRPGEGMTFHMELPLTLSVVRTFLVEIAGEPYAFPLARIERCLELPRSDISTVEDRQYFRFDDTNIALVDIHNVLELTTPPEQRDDLFVVVVSDRLNFYGLSVDRFIGEYDLVVRPLDPRLGKVPDISSVAVMLDGSPVLIFDVEDLVRSIDNLLTGRRLRKLSRDTGKEMTQPKKRILVVDDSFTVREMERKLLESRGYEVETAVDGVDGWNAVRAAHYDMVVSDVDMPRMNGIEFIRQIKQHPELKSLPVIIVSYKDKEEDRIMGLEAGANYYLTKSSFEDNSLFHAAVDLIGEA